MRRNMGIGLRRDRARSFCAQCIELGPCVNGIKGIEFRIHGDGRGKAAPGFAALSRMHRDDSRVILNFGVLSIPVRCFYRKDSGGFPIAARCVDPRQGVIRIDLIAALLVVVSRCF